MVLTLIAKKREQDGKKWINFSYVKGEKWYSVKFVKDCAPPKVYAVADGVGRAFIELTEAHKFDIIDGKNAIIFVEQYDELSADALKSKIDDEKKKIETYREKRERAKIDFLTPVNDAEILF